METPIKRQCGELLSSLEEEKDSEFFVGAVNTQDHPDYLSIVRNPMDLQQIRHRLDGGEYPNAEIFAQDVRLVFHNAMLFSHTRYPHICSSAERLKVHFDQLWQRQSEAGIAWEKKIFSSFLFKGRLLHVNQERLIHLAESRSGAVLSYTRQQKPSCEL